MRPVPYPYRGDAALGEVILTALHRVVDPEMALDIVELGLVYGVQADDSGVEVRITMTSAACPVTELIVDDVQDTLHAALGPGQRVEVEVCWEPPWGPERMSARARAVLEWD